MKTVIKERQRRIRYDYRPFFHNADAGDTDSATPSRTALIDSDGNIVAVNNDWMALSKEAGAAWNRVGPGVNYLEVCRQAGVCATSRKALAGIEEVLKGKIPSFAMDYSCQTSSGLGHFRMNVAPIVCGQARAAISHTDVTDLRVSKEEDLRRLREFARRLINAQEEERQRISREMHDDLGHRIALMSFSVRQILQQYPKNAALSIRDLNKVLDGINDFSAALRNLSHNLYPPSLRYLGLRAALKSVGKEFEETYGIHTDVVVPAEAPRLPAEMELCVFRILQESLQNIAKHSGARKVKIVLESKAGEIRLTISDSGCGFNPSEVRKTAGLGLLSMEERAMSIGACLTVNTSPGAGTEIRLSVPLHEDVSVLTVE